MLFLGYNVHIRQVVLMHLKSDPGESETIVPEFKKAATGWQKEKF